MNSGNGLPKIMYNNHSCLNIGEKNDGKNNKIIKNRNKLTPLIKNPHYIING